MTNEITVLVCAKAINFPAFKSDLKACCVCGEQVWASHSSIKEAGPNAKIMCLECSKNEDAEIPEDITPEQWSDLSNAGFLKHEIQQALIRLKN